MDFNQLYQEIETLKIDQNRINIGDSEFYDDRYNLHHRADGKWEVFHGIRNEKRNLKVYNSEEEACAAFIRLIRGGQKNRELQKNPVPRAPRAYPNKILLGVSIFCIIFGMFFAGVQIYNQDFDFVFWFFVVWIVVFAIIAICCKDERTFIKAEYLAQPILFSLLSLGCIAVMIFAPIYLIPEIMRGDTSYIFSLILAEPAFGFMAFSFFNYFVKSYIVEYIDKKKKKKLEEQEQDQEQDQSSDELEM